MPTSTPSFRFRSPMCRRFFAAYHGSMPDLPRRPASERRGKSAQLRSKQDGVCPPKDAAKKLGADSHPRKNSEYRGAERDAKSAGRGASRRSAGKGETKPTGQTPSTTALFPYETENDLRASRTVRYWRWLMGTASSQSMTSPSAEAWTTCSMFAR